MVRYSWLLSYHESGNTVWQNQVNVTSEGIIRLRTNRIRWDRGQRHQTASRNTATVFELVARSLDDTRTTHWQSTEANDRGDVPH